MLLKLNNIFSLKQNVWHKCDKIITNLYNNVTILFRLMLKNCVGNLFTAYFKLIN